MSATAVEGVETSAVWTTGPAHRTAKPARSAAKGQPKHFFISLLWRHRKVQLEGGLLVGLRLDLDPAAMLLDDPPPQN
jgi:hypothetical protein